MQTPLSMLLSDKGSSIYSVSSKETVQSCAQKMSQFNVGILLVIEGEDLVGVVSERDIVHKIVSPQLDPTTTPIIKIMTTKVVTASPRTTVQEAMHIITEQRFRHLPVLENGKLQGVISIGDLTRWVMLAQERDISSLTGYITGNH